MKIEDKDNIPDNKTMNGYGNTEQQTSKKPVSHVKSLTCMRKTLVGRDRNLRLIVQDSGSVTHEKANIIDGRDPPAAKSR